MKWIIGGLCLFLIGCAVVNVYVTFPEEKIRQAADDIFNSLETPAAQPAVPAKTSFFPLEGVAEAAEISSNVKTKTPAIDAALAKMRTWGATLVQYKVAGYVGESNRFSVEMVQPPSDAKTLQDVKELVRQENQQRDILIKEIVTVNNATKQEDEFRKEFAGKWIEHAGSGEYIQKPSGEWVKKD